MKIDSGLIASVGKAGLTINESLWLGTQKSVRCPYYPVSVQSGIILEKHKLFVGTNETVRIKRVSIIKRVSVERGSTVLKSQFISPVMVNFLISPFSKSLSFSIYMDLRCTIYHEANANRELLIFD